MFIYTLIALTAFAGNSILCRLALAEDTIAPSSFTIIRLISGALILALIIKLNSNQNTNGKASSWGGAIALFIYAAAFSFAYLELETGMGALVLFTCVQITMILTNLLNGHRMSKLEWVGIVSAFCGFIYLVSPGIDSPSVSGILLMACAGIAWGAYTLKGAQSSSPMQSTSENFFRASIISICLIPFLFVDAKISGAGILYAVLSGAITSGVGYAVWYHVLPQLSTNVAAVSQLSVPIIAALGGWLLLAESPTFQLAIASVFILGGIVLVISGKQQKRSP